MEVSTNTPISKPEIETAARNANSERAWNALWRHEGEESWRKEVLESVYHRIAEVVPYGSSVIDIGGGRGFLAEYLRDKNKCSVEVWDISQIAVEACVAKGIRAQRVDIEKDWLGIIDETGTLLIPDNTVVVSTECFEHLSEITRSALLSLSGKIPGAKFVVSVPNDRLGPDEEPQHTRKWTALEFLTDLRGIFEHCRVEALGPPAAPRNQPAFLLGVCGWPKQTKLSVTFPARDEAADIERTLASFRGCADEIVVGVDPRTVDDTRALAEKYAEVVFTLDDPRGKGADQVKTEKGVHFAWIRNQCIEKCSNDWVFMTEAHESLMEGLDTLIHFHLPEGFEAAKIAQVLRVGGPSYARQQWAFPWLAKKDPKIYYMRSTHNTLEFPEGTLVIGLPQVKTLHERVHERDEARHNQRKYQNRISLLDDWLTKGNQNSLFYLGSEWREHNPEKACHYLREYLATNRNNGAQRYHTRLILAKTLAAHMPDHLRRKLIEGNRRKKEDGSFEEVALSESQEESLRRANEALIREAEDVLLGANSDDWSRVDHWMMLGDLAAMGGKHEKALQYYLYASTGIGRQPFTIWWIDLAFYSYMPAQRLAMTYGELGDVKNALYWAERYLDLLPPDVPEEMIAEAQQNIEIAREANKDVDA